MPAWGAFVGLTAVLVVLLLVLSRTSQRVLEEAVVVDGEPKPESGTAPNAESTAAPAEESVNERRQSGAPVSEQPDESDAGGRFRPPDGIDPETDETDPDSVGDAALGEREPAARRRVDQRADDEWDGPRDADEWGESPGVDEWDDPPGVDVGGDVGGVDRPPERATRPRISTRALLGNVVVSQALFLGLLVAAAWWTGVPAAAFGLAADALTPAHAGYGVVAGILIYGVNEVGAAASERFGFSAPERLRTAMAPTDAAEWALLLLVVLPVIAVFEELLFRGALVGAVHAGFGISPWLLAVVSSAVFGLGHGAQGRVGVVVTGLLGFVLAAVFVVTWNLLVVIVAHYVVNVLEFVVREGLGWEPLAR